MDPVSHAAFGRVLVALDRDRRLGRGSVVAAVLGSLSPDIDLARAWQGWDVYLLHHQSGTHALIGAALCGLATASVVRLFVRHARWRALAAAALTGAFSHVLLDLVSGADIRALWPMSNAAWTLPLFAMADPWLLSFLVVGVALLLAVRRRWMPAAVLAAVIACLAVKGALYARARTLERAAATASPREHVEAVFGSWTRWQFFHADAETVERWDVNVGSGEVTQAMRVPRGFDASIVRQSRALPTVRNLVASHGVTFARERARPGGGHEVRWTDLRYCGRPASGSEPVCALWFGGEYDTRNRAIAAVVHLGSFVQSRAPGGTPADHE